MQRILFSILIIITYSSTAIHGRKISFLMQDVFGKSHHHSKPKPTISETKDNPLLFPKPVGFFPPAGGIPIPGYNPKNPETLTLDLFNNKMIGVYFPPMATIQEELVSGSVAVIDEDILQSIHDMKFGQKSLKLIGKAKGVSVTGSGNGMMLAMTVFLGSESKDALRFFGLHKVGGNESHVAVIGGFGSFDGANGYAAIKSFDYGVRNKKFLLFTVYLDSV